MRCLRESVSIWTWIDLYYNPLLSAGCLAQAPRRETIAAFEDFDTLTARSSLSYLLAYFFLPLLFPFPFPFPFLVLPASESESSSLDESSSSSDEDLDAC